MMTRADAEDRPTGWRRALRQISATAASFVVYSFHRFNADGCFAASGALSYTTLVSLVPLGVIALGSLSSFPIFAPIRDQLLRLVLGNFVPSIGEQAAWWFRAFAESATQTTAIGVAGIAATGILLLVTVEDQLNLIWRVTSPRPWVQRILSYWTLITLGPLLIGISLSLSTYFEIAARQVGFGQEAAAWFASSWLHGLARAVPALLEFIALTLLYCLMPNCAVRWRDGALGAFVATVAIEILKVGFSIYIGASSFYATVYGALAIIPIFLFWMYISWMAVLLGAVVAAALPNWRIDERIGTVPAGGVRLGLSLALIAALAHAQRRGKARSTTELAAELGVATTVIDEHIKPLAEAGFAAHTQSGRWVLSWSPEGATLHDLYEALHLPLAGRWTEQASALWQSLVAPAMDRIVRAETAAMQVTIASLISEILESSSLRRSRWRSARRFPEKVASE
ncbi:MAG: YihY family inner membrane protein [Alphaproteobacteria bacterium]|nr:YihY family inner membrane protein [Alphaproteobacteria bacterium]